MITLAVIGAGEWGPNLVRNFHSPPRSRVATVVDANPERLELVAGRFPDIDLSTDVSTVLGDDGIDAVVIATPTSTHFELARDALRSRKHVLVEKPLALTSKQAEELSYEADAVGRVLMVGHLFLFNRGVRSVKEHIIAGNLGRIFYAAMVRTNLGPIRRDVNAAWDLAAHDISIANYWFDHQPLSVSAVGGSWINVGLDDAVFATLRYPEDILVNLHVSWLNPRKARDITVVGDRAMLTLDDMNLLEPLRLYDKGVVEDRDISSYIDTFASFRSNVREGDIRIPRLEMGEPLRDECEHFLDCIERDRQPFTGGAEGAAVLKVLEALARSTNDHGREEPVV
ncbi:MAG: Gfo/Idh/MocA family oxidoreductase [Actinomycetota bacterium]|nr:Gfo/Idh/MocA family oxidoreductase [Actinomycetota bacterium]